MWLHRCATLRNCTRLPVGWLNRRWRRWQCCGGSMAGTTATWLHRCATLRWCTRLKVNWMILRLQEESLAMLRRIHAYQDHKSMATSLRHLAQVYKAQGRMPESESLEAESLAMLQRIHANRDHNDAGV